jgi:aryl-alcohol dehydrogenase-like predicted oxidoreductase
MKNVIGTAAGAVWNYLDKNGESSVSKMIKETKLEAKVAQRALGWLANEDKLTIVIKGRTETISLK